MKKLRPLQTNSEAPIGVKIGDFRATINSLIEVVKELQEKYGKSIEIDKPDEKMIYPDLQRYFLASNTASVPIRGYVCKQLDQIRMKLIISESNECTVILNPDGTYHLSL